MGVDHLGVGQLRQETERAARASRRQAKATLQNASIGRAGIRVYDGGWIRIEGGGLSVTGTQTVSGTLEGSGTFDWSGPMNLTGDVDLDGDLRLGTGRIIAGPITIDRLGPAGGRMVSSGQLILDGDAIYLGASTTVAGPLGVTGFANLSGGLDVTGSKNFKMEHPTKPGYWLRHGSTESPVSGIEYWGEETLDEDGTATVALPEYFEALAKPGRYVFVAGRGHAPDWTDIEDGAFTITGEPGKRVSWLVKAERYGGDFPVEEQID